VIRGLSGSNVDAGANALQRAQRAKGVAKRPPLKAMTGNVDAGANGLDRAQRGKPVAKRSPLKAMTGKVDAGGSNISLSPAFLQAIDALLQVGNIAAARTLLAPFQRGEGE
jgi:hypothetical protein